MFLKYAVILNIGKTNVFSGDETKHVVLFIFHALCTCLIAEDYEKRKKKKRNGSCVSTTYRSKSITDTYAIISLNK